MSLFVNFRSVVHALSDALDLVGINDIHHGKRVGIMAIEILRTLGWCQEDQDKVFDASLLHDVGVSSSDLHLKIVKTFDWDGSQRHAESGANLLSQFPPLSHLAPPIRLHHTHWSKLKDRYGKTERVGNLIFLADRIDTLVAAALLKNQLLEQIPAIRGKISDQSGEMFDPDLVKAFLDVSRKEAFWLALDADSVRDYMENISRNAPRTETDIDTLLGVAGLFSHVVDAKSRFTAEHSAGVARIASFLCGVLKKSCELDDEDCAKLELAGYLHDLGKLGVPDSILDKPGPLTECERRNINHHPYETYRILSRIPGFEEITRWASFHHEIPSGEGYPFHLIGNEVPFQARLLRASDIFQALAQNRPYRRGLPVQVVLEHMKQLVEDEQLDRFIYGTIETHQHEVYRLARLHSA